MKSFLLAVAAAIVLPGAGAAQSYQDAMRVYATSNVIPWASDPALVSLVRAQNIRHASLTQAEIDELDAFWRAQAASGAGSTITPVLTNDGAEFLRAQRESSGGIITEAFATDNLGLNVASSDVTSDYWQGDEAKFTEVYGHGIDAIHVSEIEFDDSAQMFQGQVSVPIVDDRNGQVIGVLTIGLRGEPFM